MQQQAQATRQHNTTADDMRQVCGNDNVQSSKTGKKGGTCEITHVP